MRTHVATLFLWSYRTLRVHIPGEILQAFSSLIRRQNCKSTTHATLRLIESGVVLAMLGYGDLAVWLQRMNVPTARNA